MIYKIKSEKWPEESITWSLRYCGDNISLIAGNQEGDENTVMILNASGSYKCLTLGSSFAASLQVDKHGRILKEEG